MRDDRSHWEERYRSRSGEPEARPSAFLVENAGLIHGRVLDLACGSGRNSIYLARRGHAVDGIDIAFAGLQRAREVATRERLSLRFVQADLQQYCLPADCYDAVINIRYLERSLFPSIAQALKADGILVFETFLIDQQGHGHPRNPAFLLQHGELRQAFESMEQLRYEEGLVSNDDGDAYLARLVARRRRREP